MTDNHNMYGLVEGTTYRINKALLDIYFDSQSVDYYNQELKKFKWPTMIDVHAVTQVLVYTKKEYNEKDGWMFYFKYDGIYMRFGKRFIAYLRYIKKHPLFDIDSMETLHNMKTGAHHKDYLSAFEIAIQHRKERERLQDVNAGILARYFNPAASVDPNFEWNRAGVFQKIWVLFNQLIKEKIWNRQYQQHLKQQEAMRLQVEERRRKKAEALAKQQAQQSQKDKLNLQ